MSQPEPIAIATAGYVFLGSVTYERTIMPNSAELAPPIVVELPEPPSAEVQPIVDC